ncbi:hypothetical protein [Myxococcus xanthus]|nr:hypothetical protein [Myxococcus xanthus]
MFPSTVRNPKSGSTNPSFSQFGQVCFTFVQSLVLDGGSFCFVM